MDILPDPLIEPISPSIRREDIDEDDDDFEIEEEEFDGDYDKHALDEERFGFYQDWLSYERVKAVLTFLTPRIVMIGPYQP